MSVALPNFHHTSLPLAQDGAYQAKTAAPSTTAPTGTRVSARIHVVKLKQAQNEKLKESVRLHLSQATKDKIASVKSRKSLIDAVISL